MWDGLAVECLTVNEDAGVRVPLPQPVAFSSVEQSTRPRLWRPEVRVLQRSLYGSASCKPMYTRISSVCTEPPIDPGSSSGKTAGFGPAEWGSSPRLGTGKGRRKTEDGRRKLTTDDRRPTTGTEVKS